MQEQRVEIVRLLVNLTTESLLVRDQLQSDFDQRKEKRRELHELRLKFKRCSPIVD